MVLFIIALVSSIGGISKSTRGHRRSVRALAAGVIERARHRQRQRRLRLSLALVLVIATAALVANSLRGAQHTANMNGSPVSGPPLVAPASVLSQTPYMGVACPQPNAIACDRVGLAIWLKRPAVSVNATIAGQPLKLDWFGDEHRSPSGKPRTEFDGYLQPAALTTRLHVKPTEGPSVDPVCGCRIGPTWLGGNSPAPIVRLQIEYPNHTRVRTQLRVGLAAGWG
jgi:hypothetical protein